MTKKSKFVLGGRPVAEMNMSSAPPSEITLTSASAFGRQAAAPFDTTMSKEMCGGVEEVAANAPPVVVMISAEIAAMRLREFVNIGSPFGNMAEWEVRCCR